MIVDSSVSIAIYAVLGLVYGFLTWKLLPKQQAVEYMTKLLACRLRISLPVRQLKVELAPRVPSSYAVGCFATFFLLFAIAWYVKPRYILLLLVISWGVRYLLNRSEPRDLSRYMPALRDGLEWRLKAYTQMKKEEKTALVGQLLEELKVVEEEVRNRPVVMPPASVISKLSPDEVMSHYASA